MTSLQYLLCWLLFGLGSALSCAASSTPAIAGATNEQRAGSASAYSGAKVGDVPLETYLSLRCGFVLWGLRGAVLDPATGAFTAKSQAGGSGSGSAVAAAIDRRGYFLTVSHAIAPPPLYVLFRGEKGMRLEEARVVWRGDLDKGEPDLAIIFVPAALPVVFEWAPMPQAADKVIGVGPVAQSFDLKFTLFGGEAGKIEQQQHGKLPAWHRIQHTAPFRQGDSGGPLVNASGQLAGINAIGIYDIRFFRSWNPFRVSREFTGGYSFRPDVEWTKQIVETDARKRAGP